MSRSEGSLPVVIKSVSADLSNYLVTFIDKPDETDWWKGEGIAAREKVKALKIMSLIDLEVGKLLKGFDKLEALFFDPKAPFSANNIKSLSEFVKTNESLKLIGFDYAENNAESLEAVDGFLDSVLIKNSSRKKENKNLIEIESSLRDKLGEKMSKLNSLSSSSDTRTKTKIDQDQSVLGLLKKDELKILDLKGFNLAESALKEVASLIKSNVNLTLINIEGNEITDGIMECFTKAVLISNAVRYGLDKERPLLTVVPSTVTSWRFDGNKIKEFSLEACNIISQKRYPSQPSSKVFNSDNPAKRLRSDSLGSGPDYLSNP